MELQGTIKKILGIQTFESGFQKRELILLTQEQYPQTISIEFLSDKISLLDNFSEGDQIKVSINIRGREWTNPQGETKYFNSISAWRVEKISTDNNEPYQYNSNTSSQIKKDNAFNIDDEDDDLPF